MVGLSVAMVEATAMVEGEAEKATEFNPA